MPILNAHRRPNPGSCSSLFAAFGVLGLFLFASPARAKKSLRILSSDFVPATRPSIRKIRIGVILHADKIRLACRGRCTFDDAAGKLYYLVPGKKYDVRALKDGLKLGGLVIGPRTTILTKRMTDCALLNGRCYRGKLVLRRDADGAVTAVDVLDIEDYLMGVLPGEMDPSWPLEALKAQAVVARTYAYTQLDKYEDEGYDLTGDTRSQMFGSLGQVPLSVREAVNETSGQVLGYKGRILDVYYHSCSGGHTADEAEIWGGAEPPPPLRGVRDPYSRGCPDYDWKAYVPLSKVLAAIEPGSLLAGPLESFRIGHEYWDGYVKNFVAGIDGDPIPIAASKFRRRIGAYWLKSDRIYRIRVLSDSVEFEGHGLGHGVGLSQWGARDLAKLGRSYQRILKFYFPGSYLAVVVQ
ncbi:MAG TPA: SpoIID/LytB domain-containing protein [Elusimicrobiota bacterium]|nr:SpoIID/LytB domain-containing protein [Elusimicrobiota bacterium]